MEASTTQGLSLKAMQADFLHKAEVTNEERIEFVSEYPAMLNEERGLSENIIRYTNKVNDFRFDITTQQPIVVANAPKTKSLQELKDDVAAVKAINDEKRQLRERIKELKAEVEALNAQREKGRAVLQGLRQSLESGVCSDSAMSVN